MRTIAEHVKITLPVYVRLHPDHAKKMQLLSTMIASDVYATAKQAKVSSVLDLNLIWTKKKSEKIVSLLRKRDTKLHN